MNKVYTLACLLLITGSAMAQRTALAPRKYSLGEAPKFVPKPGLNSAEQAKDGATVFEEDFANGLAGNNGVGAWTTGGPDGALWLQDFDGPNGDFSATTERIQSTTVANGFMIFDSNLSNDGCVPTNSCVVRDGWLISPVLDLTATPFVHLIFQQRLRWCCSADPGHFVDVSTDGGASWPTRLQVDDGMTVNIDPGTITKRVNLGPAIQADPSNVRFRFSHDGTASGNMSHYHWQVDDVKLVESPDYDMVIQGAFYDEWDFVTSVDYSTIEFGMYPFSQLRPLTLKTNVINDGRLDQTNVQMAFDVTNTGGTSVFSDTDTRALIPAATKDSLYATFTPPAATASTYTVSYVLSSDSTDENPADNSRTRSFRVDEYQYGLDDNSTAGFDDNAGAAYRMGNFFHIVNSIELTAIRVALATGSVAGTVISAELLDANLDLIEETQERTFTTADLNGTGQNKFITLPFSTPQFLNGGEDYFVCLKHFGGSDNVRVATSGLSERTASLIYDTPTDTWFFLTSTPMVRMTFDPTVGIEERDLLNGVGLGQNFPNPSNDNTVVPYSLESAAQVTFRLFDVSGKLILERNEGLKPAGQFRIQLDTQHLNEGLYFYTLNAGDVQLTKRMTVVR